MTDELAGRVQNHALGKPQLVFFYSRACELCKSVSSEVAQVAASHGIPVSRICADNDKLWAPEMLTYQVEKVPCLVLLDRSGAAVAKSGPPQGRQHMSLTLEALKQMAITLQGRD